VSVIKKSHDLRLDSDAKSAKVDQPAFLARPDGAPVYHGFPVIPETGIDGWFNGAISEFIDPDGCETGDGYVVAPDGTRAGLVWDVAEGETTEILPPDDERWGVYAIWFIQPIKSVEDLVFNFRFVLPDLQKIYERTRK